MSLILSSGSPLSSLGLVRVWDLETRLSKPESLSFDVYKRCAGCSVAVVWELGDPGGWTFYSDADEYPYDMKGLSEHLAAADLSVGYNSLEFDHFIVKSMVESHTITHELDLYQNVVSRVARPPWTKGAWTLGSVAQRTLGLTKTKDGGGASAPALSRNNRSGELFSYCLRDVALTGRLFEHCLTEGYVVDPSGDHIDVLEVTLAAIERAKERSRIG